MASPRLAEQLALERQFSDQLMESRIVEVGARCGPHSGGEGCDNEIGADRADLRVRAGERMSEQIHPGRQARRERLRQSERTSERIEHLCGGARVATLLESACNTRY